MVASAKAHEASTSPRDFRNPADVVEAQRFRGSFSGYERDAFFVRDGTLGRFVDAATVLGVDFDSDGRAVAPIDADGDGDLDLAFLSLQGLQLLWNTAPPKRWLRLRLKATRTEPLALGAQVVVRAGTLAQLDRVRLTAGFHTQVSRDLHFGLGAATEADVEVRWPSGAVQRFAGLRAEQRHVLTEGAPAAATLPVPRWPESGQPRLQARFDAALAATPMSGGPKALLVTPGRPALVNFWAPWCAGCDRELPDLQALHAAREEQLDVVGVLADPKDPAAALAFLEERAIAYRQALADDALVAAYFGPEGKMELPATFLFDAEGRLRRSWYRRIDAAEVGAAVDALKAPPTALDHLEHAGRLARAGDPQAALRTMELAAAAEPRSADVRFNLALAALGVGNLDRAATLLREVLAETPRHPRAWQALALTERRRGHLEAAAEAARAGLRYAGNPTEAADLQAELRAATP